MLFKRFCPWTKRFLSVETPFVHGRRDFYLLQESFDAQNARKPHLWKYYSRKMPVLTDKGKINSVGRQERVISLTNFRSNARKQSLQNLAI